MFSRSLISLTSFKKVSLFQSFSKLKNSSFLERIGFPLVTFVNSVWKYFVCKNSPIRALSKIAFWSKDNCFKIFPKFCIRRDFRHAKISSFALLHFQQTSKLLPIFKYSYFRYYWSLTTDQADWLAVPFWLQIWTELSCEVEAQLDQGRCSCRGKNLFVFPPTFWGIFLGAFFFFLFSFFFFCNFFFSGGFVWALELKCNSTKNFLTRSQPSLVLTFEL